MKTVLYDRHVALGAKIVPFAGWDMPVSYKGVVSEHQTVRQAVGLFDVSHMGRILVEGSEAEKILNELSTNQIAGKPEGSATYTVWCHPEGGSVDDVMIYRKSKEKFFIVVNASNRQKDLDHLLAYSKGKNVHVQDLYQEGGILALQGPRAEALLALFFTEIKTLKGMHFLTLQDQRKELIISRTGYTGAGGFELYGSNELISRWWDHLLYEGKQFGIEPVGLGARDTLRLEMGFALYGHELSDTISPNESVASWTIKWDKPFFIGKESLEKLEKSLHKRFAYGVKLVDKGIAREGFSVMKDNHPIGVVTSGSFSPTLNESIALILTQVPLEIDDLVQIQIRQHMCQAKVTQLPFVRKKL